jgi:PKD repeat protein
MSTSFLKGCAAILALSAISAAGCTMKEQEAPDFGGPSEFGTSITIAVSPDILQQDGASQSVVTITARGPSGSPAASVGMRAEILVGGTLADFGTLSARSLVTGSDGRATLTYTAPPAPPFPVDTYTIVNIAVTPIGTDFGNSAMRSASLRLVPKGVVVPPAGLQPSFTMTPTAPTDNQTVLFNASSSQAPANNPIVSYDWDFGDRSRATGRTVNHAYEVPGTYVVTLTISDALGRSASTSQSINVSPGINPTAVFTFSPAEPVVNQRVHFNAAQSTPAPGREIDSYVWDFGDGSPKGSGMQTSHVYTRAGTYRVLLTVTDDVGRQSTSAPRDIEITP